MTADEALALIDERHKKRYKEPDPNCRFCRGKAEICSACNAFDTPAMALAREVERLRKEVEDSQRIPGGGGILIRDY